MLKSIKSNYLPARQYNRHTSVVDLSTDFSAGNISKRNNKMNNKKIIKNALYDAVKLYKNELDMIERKIEDNTWRLRRGYVDASANLKSLNKAKKFYDKKDKQVREFIRTGTY